MSVLFYRDVFGLGYHLAEEGAVRVVIAGGGAAGSFAALTLARGGHEVVVVEQDRLEPAGDVESAAAAAFRTAAPQIVQPHIVMARCRELLMERLPDLYEQLLAAGVTEAPLAALMPTTMQDRGHRPGDERLAVLMTRRSTFDWVLQRAIRAERGVTVRCGVRVRGLEAAAGSPPHVVGVRTDEGDFAADLVVDALGRRSPIDNWLGEIGARRTAVQWAECGVAYFGRHYRLRPGAEAPGPATTRFVGGFDEFTAGIWGADNGTMQMAVVPLARDHRFKTARHPEVFTAVLRTIPALARWLEALEPISGVFIMGAVHNTMRRLVADGTPVATGLAAIGDSVCATNPTLGRGLTFALAGAAGLADTIREHPGDPLGQAMGMDELACEHILPYYEDQAAIDYARLRVLDHNIFGGPRPEAPADNSTRVTYAQLRTAAEYDGTAFRGFWKIMGMISRPEAVYTDAEVVACTRAALRKRGGEGAGQPTCGQLAAALAR